jgi:hypothetical protein
MDNKTKGVVSYLLITFGMAWILWEIPLRLGVSTRSPLFQLAVLPGAFAPAVAAVIVRKWITHEGFADAGLHLNLRKWPYYLLAWLLPLLVTPVIVALAVALGISQPDFSLQRALRTLAPDASPPASMPPAIWLVLPVQLMVTALVATPVLWGEEFGRGYTYPDQPVLGLVVFPVSTILLSIIFGWLRLRTGSVWAASLAHAATNAIGGSLTTLLFIGGLNGIFVSYLGLLGWIPLGGLCAWIVLRGGLAANSEGAP